MTGPYCSHVPPWVPPSPWPYLSVGFTVGLIIGGSYYIGVSGIDPAQMYAHTALAERIWRLSQLKALPIGGVVGLLIGGLAWGEAVLRSRSHYNRVVEALRRS